MKKIILTLLLILTIMPLASCNGNEKPLISGQVNSGMAIPLSKEQLEEKMLGDDFILYVYTEGCTSCNTFLNNVLEPFINKYYTEIYKIETSNIKGLIPTPSKYGVNPKLVIFNDGKVYSQTTIHLEPEAFTSVEGLKSYLDTQVVFSKMLKQQYFQLKYDLAAKKSFIVYYGWDSCGDCSYLKDNYLHDFLMNNKSDNYFYYLEVSEFRKYKTPTGDGENEEIWNEFLETTGINIDGNRGVVPTICYYENGVLKDYVIYFNDKLEYDEETQKYKVVGSYHKDADEIIGKEFDSYVEYQKGVEDFHNNRFKEFMKKYYK